MTLCQRHKDFSSGHMILLICECDFEGFRVSNCQMKYWPILASLFGPSLAPFLCVYSPPSHPTFTLQSSLFSPSDTNPGPESRLAIKEKEFWLNTPGRRDYGLSAMPSVARKFWEPSSEPHTELGRLSKPGRCQENH
jgi:hypothetical protein